MVGVPTIAGLGVGLDWLVELSTHQPDQLPPGVVWTSVHSSPVVEMTTTWTKPPENRIVVRPRRPATWS